MNFLQLCQAMVSEFGLSGGTGPNAVTSQSGELGNVVNWIRSACLDTDNKWEDWRYLWLKYTGTLTSGNSTPSAIPQSGVTARRWKTKTLKYRTSSPLGTSWTTVAYMPFQDFEECYDPDTAIAG
ncbi:MAG: hypothetical protein ACRDK7_10115, partial [Solirubrobacteraceae bacterium]